jgi:hypothetical protein
VVLWGAEPAETTKYFAIQVVDQETGRGVPLIELRTVHGVRYYTDSNGLVAFHEAGLMGQEVFFHVAGHGYEFPRVRFGYRGKALRVTAGGRAKLEVRRINIAERLYRITGAGIYRDSVLLGEKVPIREPLLNAQVLGSDSVQSAVHGGKVYWFWGDTNRPDYPLGNFHVPGAVSDLPGSGGLPLDAGIDLRYFLDKKGFARATAPMPGSGPTWMTTLVPLPDADGGDRLFASFVKVEPPLKVHARGLMIFNEDRQEFEKLADVDLKAPAFPTGHAFRHPESGVEYVYFAHPFPVVRVRARGEDFRKITAYETFTCLKEGSRLDEPQLERDATGRLRYSWKKNSPAVDPNAEKKLLAAGKIRSADLHWQLRDRDTGKAVQPHAGSVYWNAYRRRWVLIAVEFGGSSLLGEVWYAEADTLVGPWLYGVKIITHDRYDFYNPKHHPMFDREVGRIIHFEGTHANTFSGNPIATPRYNYNQILYRLDLADPRLILPVPVYDLSPGSVPETFGLRRPRGKEAVVAFFAPDRPLPGTVPVLEDANGLRIGRAGESGALFHALPAEAKESATTRPLYEYRQREGDRRAYSTDPEQVIPGFERMEKPLCRVWRGR